MSAIRSRSELYERQTFWSVTEGSKEVKCGAKSKDYLCLVRDNTILLHQALAASSNCGEQNSSLESAFLFDDTVDCVGWAKDASAHLLVAGDRVGLLHFICPEAREVLYSQAFASNEHQEEAVFADVKYSEEKELLILMTNGSLTICKNFSPGIFKNCNQEDIMSELQRTIQLSRVDLACAHGSGAAGLRTLHSPTLTGFASIGSGGGDGIGMKALCVWNRPDITEHYKCYDSIDHVTFQGLVNKVVQCEISSCGKYLITLGDNGVVCVWLLWSLVVLNVWVEPGVEVKDLSIFTTTGSAGSSKGGGAESQGSSLISGDDVADGLCLIVDNGQGETMLKVVTLPDLHVIHSMMVSPSAKLFHGPSTEDAIYYLDTSSTSSVEVMCLVQALPEKQLATMLSQHRFAEALSFAKEYDINSQIVYQSQAHFLNSKLGGADYDKEDIKALMQCLDKVMEEDAIADLIFEFAYESFDLTLNMLLYAKRKLTSPRLRLKVASALNKLTTYQIVNKNFSSKEWQSFLDTSPLELMKRYLCLGDLQSASCVHNRHMGSLVGDMNSECLLDLLYCVPEAVNSDLLGQWACSYLVPFILQHLPQTQSSFLYWVVERIKNLELIEKEEWPSNGMRLAGEVLQAFSSYKNPSLVTALQPHPLTTPLVQGGTEEEECSVSDLKALWDSLSDIAYLKTSLQCTVTLSEYEAELREAMVYRLLDKVVAAELIQSTVRTKVKPYIEKHNLDLDKALLNYTKRFLSQCPWYSSVEAMGGSPYEAKAIALLQAINDKELFLTGCLEVLRHLQASWSEGVESLVQQCVELDHPTVPILKKQYQLLQLKRLLYTYDIRDFNFADVSRGRIYIRKILASGQAGCLKDALEVSNMYQLAEYEVYCHHIVNLVSKDKLEAAADVLSLLPEELQIVVAHRCLSRASCKLQLSFSPDMEDPADRQKTIETILLNLQILEKCVRRGSRELFFEYVDEEWHDLPAAIQLYKTLLALQVEFSVYLTPMELRSRQRCEELLAMKVKEFGERSAQESSSTTSKVHHGLYRFCHLLGFGEEEVTNAVLLKLVQGANIEGAKKICREVIFSPPLSNSRAKLLLRVVQEVWSLMKTTPTQITRKDAELIRDIASFAVTSCGDALLEDAVGIFGLCIFTLHLYSQTADSELMNESLNVEEPAFSQWNWQHRYNEEALILEREALLPLAAGYILARGAGSGEVVSLASQLSSILRDSGHLQLALCSMLNWMSAGIDSSGPSPSSKLGLVTSSTPPTHFSPSSTEMTSADMSMTMLKADTPISVSPLACSQLQNEKSLIFAILNSLVAKVLSHRRVDHDYALSLLLQFPPSQATPHLKAISPRTLSNYSTVMDLCKLSMDYAAITRQPGIRERSESILRSAGWGKKLGKHKVSYSEAFRGGKEERTYVARNLLRAREVPMETVLQYCCEEVGQPEQYILPTYLRIILTEWEEPYVERATQVMSGISNRKVVRDLFANLLQSKSSVCNKLTQHTQEGFCRWTFQEVHPYDYEKLQFLLEFFKKEAVTVAESSSREVADLKVDQGLLILNCLRHYKRVSAPSESERVWFRDVFCKNLNPDKTFSGGVDLPDSALSRLPFHPLLYGDPMKVIGHEISVTNRDQLATIAKIVRLPMDDFYSSCITAMIEQSLPSFQEVAPLLSKMVDDQYALRVARWLAEHLKKEEDRIMALQAALHLATRCKTVPETPQGHAFEPPEKKERLLKTMLALAKTKKLLRDHHLDHLVTLDLTGAKLIFQLYTDAPTLSTAGNTSPPIHLIAAEVAQLFEIRLSKVQNKLFEQWLTSFGSQKKEMDLTQMSILEDPTEEGFLESEDEGTLTMKRLIYLLKVPENLESNVLKLLNWAKTVSGVSAVSRARALQVLLAIAPPPLIEQVTNTSIADIRDFLHSALFVCELESLKLSLTISVFQTCKKEGLIRTLWKNHSHKPKAVWVVSELCLSYGIGDGGLWSRILDKLHHFTMLPYLRHLLRELTSRQPQHSSIPGLPKVWEKTLMAPFETMSVPLSEFQKEECDQSLAMVHECPFPLELDVGAVIGQFVRLELRAHALSCVLMLPQQQQQQLHSKLILEDLPIEKLVNLLNEITSKMMFGGQQAKELVYKYLDEHNLHEALLAAAGSSHHFCECVGFLITHNRIDHLLLRLLQSARLREAAQLVRMYQRVHGGAGIEGVCVCGGCAPGSTGGVGMAVDSGGDSAENMEGISALKDYVSQHSSFFSTIAISNLLQ